MRARRSIVSRVEAGGTPVTGPWSFRELCEHRHGWAEVGGDWLQCRLCWWCKPKLSAPLALKALPAILRGRVLPPLSGKVNVRDAFRNAGFVLDDDKDSVLSTVRVRVVQYSFAEDPLIRRCAVDVRFREHGWQGAAAFFETALSELMRVISRAEPRKPRALWLAIQAAFTPGWQKPWRKRS